MSETDSTDDTCTHEGTATDGGHVEPASGERTYIDSPPDTAPATDRSLAKRLVEALPTPWRALRYGIAIFVAAVWVLPFVGLFMASIRPLSEILAGWWHFENLTITFQNYWDALTLSSPRFAQALVNTAIVTVPAVLLTVLLGAMAAYPFARFEFPFRKSIFFLFILVMAAPPELVAMGNYTTLRAVGLFDTYIGLILVHVGWGLGWCVLFFRNYMLGLPEALEEAARVDGASRYQIFKSIILPLTGPALVSVAVIQFTWIWNAFFFPLVFMRSAAHKTAPQVLPLMKGRLQIDWGLVAAGSVLTMAVPILLFLFLQRYYERGMIGSVAD